LLDYKIVPMTFTEDERFGEKAEEELFDTIRKRYGECYRTDKWNTFDYIGKNFQVELKHRRINYNQYPTIMIGLNKLQKAAKSPRATYFLWKFKDGLYEWKFDPNEYTVEQGGRCDRGVDERKDCGFIDMKLLKEI